MKKRLAMFALAGVMAVSTLTGCGKLNDSDVVATVDGDEISAGLANFYARMMQAEYETWYGSYMGDDMWSMEISDGETYEDSVKEDVLEELENMLLMEDHMDEYDVTISEDEQEAIEEAAAAFDEANESEDKDKVSGSTENVERLLTLLTISQKMTTAIQDTADTEVSDEEAAQKAMQYVQFSMTTTDDDGNSVDMTDEEKEELKTQAESFAEGATTAEDFSTYATESGYTATDATFDADETETIPAELAQAADALEEGGVTDVIETDDSYYVAKVTSLFDEEATETEKESIISERKQEKYDDTIEEWRDNAEITVNKKVWKKVDFNELSVTINYGDEETEDTEETETDETEDAEVEDTETEESEESEETTESTDTTEDTEEQTEESAE